MLSAAILLVSGLGRDDYEKLIRGSAITKQAAYAAIPYMACAGNMFLYVLRRKNVISFSETGPLPDESELFVSYQMLVQTSPLAIAYLLYLVATMTSFRGVSVPMYTTLRRTTMVFTIVVDYVLTRQKYTPYIVGSVIVIGALIGRARDLSYDAFGYGVVLMANLSTAIYLATIARIGILCGPFLLLLSYVQGDLKAAVTFPYLLSPGFMPSLYYLIFFYAVLGV